MLENPAAGLFLAPGMGKTSVTLAAQKVFANHGINGVLVVAPLRVCHNVWRQEVAKWTDFCGTRVQVVHGTPKQRLAALAEPADIYVTNPENVVWLVEKSGWTPPDMLVLDESTKFKNSRSKRFRAIRKWIKAGAFKRRYILTGTPAPNGYEDLFGQMYVVDCGERLGQYVTHFRMKYFVQDFFGHTWTLRDGAGPMIQDKLKDVVMWMDGSEYLDMPELSKVKVMVDLPKDARAAYDSLERDFVAMIDDELVTAFSAGTLSGKLRQAANGSVYDSTFERSAHYLHDAKLEALRDLKDELGGEPLLVAYEFRSDAKRIQDVFRCPLVGGGVSSKLANRNIEAWCAGDLPMLAIHPASGGHGLNLQSGGNHLAWYGIPWDLELYDQMIARLWRQGQENRVVVHHIMANDSIDSKVYDVLTAKDRTQRDILEAFRAQS
jgi:hypothetical protein